MRLGLDPISGMNDCTLEWPGNWTRESSVVWFGNENSSASF